MCAALIHPSRLFVVSPLKFTIFSKIHILTQTKSFARLDISQHCTQLQRLWCDKAFFVLFTEQNSCTSTFITPAPVSLLHVRAKIVSFNIVSAILHSIHVICSVYWNQKCLLFFQNAIELCPKFHSGQTWTAWIGAKCMAKHTLKNTTV